MAKGYELPRYGFKPAPEQQGAEPGLYDVVIVGGGVVGLSLACELGRLGVKTVLLDEDNTVGVRGLASRGVCYARRTLQMLQRLGIYERVRQKGVVWKDASIYRNRQRLYGYTLADSESEKYPPFINIQQYHLEAYLVDRAAEMPNVDIRWVSEVKAVGQRPDWAELSVQTPQGGYRMRSKWVVACDGANSTVRSSLGIEPDIRKFDDHWLIVDFEFRQAVPHQRAVWIESEENAGRAIWFHPMADDVWRLDYQIGKREDALALMEEKNAEATVRCVLTSLFGEGVDFELVWVGPWAYRTYVLPDFKVGRVLFAGDAAHLKSPFGARGGNSGIQDVENLGWKLAAVLRQEAPEQLLDSYSEERREAALENVKVTTRTARFLTPRSRMERALRDVIQTMAIRHPFARALVNGGRMSQANRYQSSPICRYGDAAFASGFGIEVGAAAEDGRVVCGEAEQSLIDMLGRDACVLYIQSAPDAAARQLVAALNGRGIRVLWVAGDAIGPQIPAPNAHLQVLEDRHGDVRAVYGGMDGMLYLVRPDAYIGWRALSPRPEDVAEAMDQCIGRTSPPRRTEPA